MHKNEQSKIQIKNICNLFIQNFSKDYKLLNKKCNYKFLKKNITKSNIPLYTISFTVQDKKNNDVKILATQTDSNREVKKNIYIYKYLAENGFNTKDYSAPKMIGGDMKNKFFFRELREGEVLVNILSNKKNNYEFYLKKAAKWSVKLHNVNIVPYSKKKDITKTTNYYKNIFGTKESPDKYVRNFIKYLSKNNQGDLVKKIIKLFKKIEMPFRKNGEILDNENLCLIHGDFHANHVFFENKKVFVIDFDWAGIWHPYWDMGRFCAYFIKNFSKIKQQEYEKIFLNEYLKNRKLENNHQDIINNKTFLFAQAFTTKDIIIEHLTDISHELSNKKSGLYFPADLEKKHKTFNKLIKFTDFLEDKIAELYKIR